MSRKSATVGRAFVTFERIEGRILFATDWGAAPRLINQDDAASVYSSITGQGITVATVDSGINYNHPALGGGFGDGFKVVGGFDFIDNDDDPMDEDGHGTAVAGVIAADGYDRNGLHYQGIAPDANLVALRVTNGDDGAADSTIEKALDWVIANYREFGIKVVNISLGSGSHDSDFDNSTLSDEFEQLRDLNIFVVAASGNSGDEIFGSNGIAYPAADANVVAVGSVTASDSISGFTQRGETLDLLAPGDDITTTTRSGSYATFDGTSFASPAVAGAAALVAQANPGISREAILSILRASGATNNDGDTETGRTTGLDFPRLDLLAALRLTDQRKTSKNNAVGSAAVASDIAYDEQGVLHLAYYDPSKKTILYATRDTAGRWSRTRTIDASGDDVGSYLSIAIDSTGKPAIAYFDNTNSDLKYAHFDGANWDIERLDSAKSVGQFASLTFDNDGDPVIAYYRKSGGDLRLLTTNASGAWTRFDVDTGGDVGAWADVSVAQSAGIVAIGYADLTNGNLKYARYADGQWTIFTVDDLAGGAAYVDLNIHNNQAFLSYQDLANGDLKFAKREGGEWHTETVYTPGNAGQFSSLVFDANNGAHIVFHSKSKNFVYEAVGNFGSWSVTKIGNGGSWLSATATDDEQQLTFVSLDAKRKTLQFGAV